MPRRISCLVRLGLSVALFALCWSATAPAQYPYPYPPYGGVYAPYAGPGGYMAGQAQVIGSVGQFQNQQQDAQIQHQKALQEELKTKKAEFDWKNYEAEHTPTFGMNQAKIKSQKEYRVLTNPTDGEIASGEAFNVLLPYLQDRANKGVMGPPVPISPSIIEKINVTGTLTTGNAGLLKDGGANLEFPLVLRGDAQKHLSMILPQVVSSCVNGTLDFKTYKQVRADVDKMRDDLKKQFHKEEIDGGTFLIGTRFLDDLDSAVKVLEDPNASKFFNGTYRAKGSNVAELVHNVTAQGLKFAPATTGDENAYMALYNSMITFVMAGNNPSGFNVQLSPGHMPLPKKGGS